MYRHGGLTCGVQGHVQVHSIIQKHLALGQDGDWYIDWHRQAVHSEGKVHLLLLHQGLQGLQSHFTAEELGSSALYVPTLI